VSKPERDESFHPYIPMKSTTLPFTLIALAFAPLARAEVPEGLSPTDWQSIRAAYEAGQHAFAPTETGWTARNPGQRWTTEFDGRGFLATPDEGDWTWGLELISYGTGEARIPVSGTPSVAAEGQRLAYRWDDKLEEWWINDRRGLEHGYIVAERPSTGGASDAPLTFRLGTRGGLVPRISPDARDLIFEDAEGRAMLNYAGLKVWDAEGRILASRFEEDEGATVRLVVDDDGAVYPVTVDPMAQQAYLKAGNTDANDQFGWSVAVSGDTVVVGAPREASSATGVTNGPGGSADNSAEKAGAVYVFVRTGNHWSQQAYLKAGNTGADDQFGYSVAVSGDTVVVGAPLESSSATGVTNGPGGSADISAAFAGAAYVFVRSGTDWSQQAYLKAGNTDAGDQFGTSVAVSGDTVVVGAIHEDSDQTGVANGPGGSGDNSLYNSGAAYVFARSGSDWSQQAYLKAGNTGWANWFGWSVAISGDTVVVGAFQERSNQTGVTNGPGGSGDESASDAGAAYVFVRNGLNWSQQAYLKAGNTNAGDYFGWSVGVADDTIVVGALLESSNATGVENGPGGSADNSAFGAGAAYVFFRSEAEWSQQAYLKAGNTDAGDRFGQSVAVSGDTVVVGSPFEGSNATGVTIGPGGSADNSAPAAGAAYLFTRSGATWAQQAYLKAGNSGTGDYFGYSVSVSGDTVVAGAHRESSSQAGVSNGPGGSADNSAGDAGAAYVFADFELPPAPPRLTVTRPRAFPATPLGRRSRPQAVGVGNLGGTAATGLAVRTSGKARRDFRLTRPARVLAPGAETRFRATFRPRATGARRATATVRASNAPARSVRLRGRGR